MYFNGFLFWWSLWPASLLVFVKTARVNIDALENELGEGTCSSGKKCCAGINEHGKLTVKCKADCGKNQGIAGAWRNLQHKTPAHHIELRGEADRCCFKPSATAPGLIGQALDDKNARSRNGQMTRNIRCLQGLLEMDLLEQIFDEDQRVAARDHFVRMGREHLLNGKLNPTPLVLQEPEVRTFEAPRFLVQNYFGADALSLPCVGLESETSAMKVHTKQKPVLQLAAGSICSETYPLMQITGDMESDDHMRTLELITGPVPAISEVLRDMNTLYKSVFDFLLSLSKPRDRVDTKVTPDMSLVIKNESGVIVVNPLFQAQWRAFFSPRFSKVLSSSKNGILATGINLEHLLLWTVSPMHTGRARLAHDVPADYYGVGKTGLEPTVGVQATFEVPIDFGLHWQTFFRPLFLGDSHVDIGKRLSGTIHRVAGAISKSLLSHDNALVPLLWEDSKDHSAGIMASILHFVAQFAVEQTGDDATLQNHSDEGIDVSAASCDIARKNSMILNPRFGLIDLLAELDEALVLEGRRALRERYDAALLQIANDDASWNKLRAQLKDIWRISGAAPEICVNQQGMTSCKHWIGIDEPAQRSSSIPWKSYEQNPVRYENRMQISIRQTLVLASAKAKHHFIHGCGHPIKPMFRTHGKRKFARFEDRGTGRIAALLEPSLDSRRWRSNGLDVSATPSDHQKHWFDSKTVGSLSKYDLAAKTLRQLTYAVYDS